MVVGEGNEEIGNMIQNYIKEIEELRYKLRSIIKSSFSNEIFPNERHLKLNM